MSESPIKHIFIGNTNSQGTIANITLSNKSPRTNFNDCTKIFNKICNTGQTQPGSRNKLLVSNSLLVYYEILSPDVFFLAYVENNFPDYHVYGLFESIHKKQIHTKVSLNGELNSVGETELKEEVSNKQSLGNDPINSINKDINDTKVVIKKNVDDLLKSTNDARELENISSNIKVEAQDYQDNANDLKKETFWQNCKWTIIVIGAIVLIALVIVIPIVA